MSRSLVIDGVRIDDASGAYVIAEIGHNHQGDVERCKQLFRAAKECGASAVKLQKRSNRELYTRRMYEGPYENRNSFGSTYGTHREALEFGYAEYGELCKYAGEIGIAFFATAFDFDSADFLMELDVPAFKIASGDLTNIPLLQHVASFGRPIVISTGGGSMEDVQRAYDAVIPINPDLCILQCTAGYPPAWEELDLRVIETFRDRFPDVVVGLSSHDSGIAMAPVAYLLGARVIEKHFTLNRAMKGSDHAFSLEPPGLRRLVRDINRARVALGSGRKVRYESEEKPLLKMSKKIVASRALSAGHRISAKDLALKSPGDGLPPYRIYDVIGRVTKRALDEEETIGFEDLTDG